ncbi:MAG TPA: neutral/alkaline non-lysosomal ceramidase N-terminal domain-containing protein [Bacteroidales bacterium]|nr:neutral/alkaline non-lysosomal ceramidase N-terminal domain-containing protein [Bacteroidales bacterium]
MKKFILWSIILLFSADAPAQFMIGVAKKNITPAGPIWLSGYAARRKPSEGVLQDIWAKALVIEGKKNEKLLILTTDLIGLTHEMSQYIFDAMKSEYGFERSQVLLNSSHTHSGPVIWPGLAVMYNLADSDLMKLVSYNQKLKKDLVDVAGEAIGKMEKGRIMSGHGTADFAINRRQQTEKGVSIGLNPSGPVDHDVPVVKFISDDGSIIAILFGYACHNTVLDGYEICGDYAGFAQSEVESNFPGTIAMFMQGCGADQNPNPRRSIDNAKVHGRALAEAVTKTVNGELATVEHHFRTAFQTATLDFEGFDPGEYIRQFSENNLYKKSRAGFLLQAYERGYDLGSVTYPVQAVRFGRDLAIVALAGEVVVDYSLKTKQRYPKENLFVSGYCSEVPCYIPSLRVLKEGGYEPEESMIYYGLPGPLKDNVEEKISETIDWVMRKTGGRR